MSEAKRTLQEDSVNPSAPGHTIIISVLPCPCFRGAVVVAFCVANTEATQFERTRWMPCAESICAVHVGFW